MKFKGLYIGLLIMGVISCGNYQKVYKSDDPQQKYELAENLFKSGDYVRSERLFSQIVDQYLGRPSGERILYMLAQGYYQRQRYELAAEMFLKFITNYPKSEKIEEAYFLEAMCYFQQISVYSLDQLTTYKAIDKFQFFIDRFVNSEYLKQANENVLILVTQLQKKSFEIAKGYHKIKDYKAAIRSFDNFLLDNPGTIYKEKAMFYRLHSAYEIAVNSIQSKEQARLKEALNLYNNFVKDFPNSEFKKEADRMQKQILKKLNNN